LLHSDVLKILDPGLGATLQDQGRPGWKKFGVPPGGAMDDHAARWANRLLDNTVDAPVIEFLLQGARLEILQDVWIAITGADATANIPMWRATPMRRGDLVQFPHNRSGLWIYLAIAGGFSGERWLGSASVFAQGKIGLPFTRGDLLQRAEEKSFALPAHVAGRLAPWNECRDYAAPPPLRVWPGPQWDLFDPNAREKFFSESWTVSSQSDRAGYRLTGEPLESAPPEMLSEPVLVGSIQIPTKGQPIVTMRDGPTVGGYPKIGLVDAADFSWLAQCRPGQRLKFKLHDF
jgi:biotin-dependent carboxylase-like uncharacterized protein